MSQIKCTNPVGSPLRKYPECHHLLSGLSTTTSTALQDLIISFWITATTLLTSLPVSMLVTLNIATRGHLLKCKLSHVTPLSKTLHWLPYHLAQTPKPLERPLRPNMNRHPVTLLFCSSPPPTPGMLPPESLGTSGSLWPRMSFPQISPGLDSSAP